MIIINKDTTNKVAVTLADEPNFTNTDWYLFVFTNRMDGVVKYFQGNDTSLSRLRYSLFNITENQTEDLLNSQIYMTGNTQEFDYQIYSLPSQLTTLNELDQAYTDFMTSGTTIEVGYGKVIGLETNNAINEIYL